VLYKSAKHEHHDADTEDEDSMTEAELEFSDIENTNVEFLRSKISSDNE
jgi:hypothetical protein